MPARPGRDRSTSAIVHAAEDLLAAFERPQLWFASHAGRFPHQLHGVPQFLDRDPHVVEPIWQIDGPRLLAGGAKSRGTFGDACLDRPAPSRLDAFRLSSWVRSRAVRRWFGVLLLGQLI